MSSEAHDPENLAAHEDDLDELIDQLATATSSSDLSAMRRVYARLAVPASMVG